MERITRLIREARDVAEIRGHALQRFTHCFSGGGDRAFSRCCRCGKEVAVISYPKPNEIDIAGEAVALGCVAKENQNG